MRFELSALEVLISGLYLIGTFAMAGRLAHWAGMNLLDIERYIDRFLQRYCSRSGTFYAGYPRPALARDLERFDGGVSWRRGLLFLCFNMLMLFLFARWTSEWINLVWILTGVSVIEWYGIRRYIRWRRAWYMADLERTGRYYRTECRLVGCLHRTTIFPSKGRVLRLEFAADHSGAIAKGEYALNVWVPPDLDHLIPIGVKTRLDVFANPVTVFLESEPHPDMPNDICWWLHDVYPDVLAPNNARDLRLIRDFVLPILSDDMDVAVV